jgi:hypothetical protein
MMNCGYGDTAIVNIMSIFKEMLRVKGVGKVVPLANLMSVCLEQVYWTKLVDIAQ